MMGQCNKVREKLQRDREADGLTKARDTGPPVWGIGGEHVITAADLQD